MIKKMLLTVKAKENFIMRDPQNGKKREVITGEEFSIDSDDEGMIPKWIADKVEMSTPSKVSENGKSSENGKNGSSADIKKTESSETSKNGKNGSSSN